MNADKWLWPIFGCKVGQSVQIGMKLKLDVWHHPLDVYAKFQTDTVKCRYNAVFGVQEIDRVIAVTAL